ncbi:hypothetical protein D3C76_1417620 [compost metagenome]
MVTIQLWGSIQIIVCNRQIRRHAWLNGEGQADQVGRQGIQAVSFGIEGENFGLFQALHPIGEGFLIQNGDIAFLRQGRLCSSSWCFCRCGWLGRRAGLTA